MATIKFTNEEVNASFVVWDGKETLLGQVQGGSFASTAWIEHDPYRTMTGRVEVLWADDAQRADTSRDNLTRVKDVTELEQLLNNPDVKVDPLFRDYCYGVESVKKTFFGLYRE